MKLLKVIFFIIVNLSAASLLSQIDISEARSLPLGTEVTVEGVVTNGFELGIIRYIQDGTAGIAVYPGNGSVGDFPSDVSRGDLIRVRGTLKVFNELLEIDPVLEYEVLSSSNDLPDPLVVTPDEIDEELEGQLVTINGVTFDDGGSVFGVGNYSFTNGNESSEIYVRSNHPLLGEQIPLATVNLTGIVSQFNSIYQVLPRGAEDIDIADNFFITSAPKQSAISQNGFTVSWSTNAASNSIVRYGTTQALGEEVTVDEMVENHSVDVTGLNASEFYYVQVVSDNGTSLVEAPVVYYATASLSSGVSHVYFNQPVDASFSNGDFPSSTTSAELENALINYIENAEESIDIAMYNTNRNRIINALSDAYNRGVRVRMVTDTETANLALSNPTPPFPIIRGNSDGLMHNKFLVIDRNSVNDSWVISGSLNLTEQGMANDFNNLVAVQDQALCKAYELEFEEMWGSDGEAPGIFNVKFGSSKQNNTPHTFNVAGMIVESYFSPTDNTTAEIAAEIDQADNDVSFALLTFTNNTLGTAMLDAFNRGVDLRGIIDNINDQGSEYSFLSDRGLNVTPDFTTAQTHHKYCIIDGFDSNSDPVLVTGSHNWSASAETRNDENTLLFHSAVMTNIFQQEFEARWCEVMGSSGCTTSVTDLEDSDQISIFPNPVNEMLNIEFKNLDLTGEYSISIFNTQGHRLSTMLNLRSAFERIDVAYLNSGNYILSINMDGALYIKRFVKL